MILSKEETTVEAAEMRSLLKRMCNAATAKARKLGFDIDFEHGLFIEADMNIWIVGCICSDKVCQFVTENGAVVALGAKFMSYVPAIDRLAEVPALERAKSPIGQMYHRSMCSSVLLPLADEFAYKFSDTALEMILQAFMAHGSFLEVDNPEKSKVKTLLEEERQRAYEERRGLIALKSKLSQSEYKRRAAAMLQDQMIREHDLRSQMSPMKIPFVPKPCKSFEELSIVTDCYSV